MLGSVFCSINTVRETLAICRPRAACTCALALVVLAGGSAQLDARVLAPTATTMLIPVQLAPGSRAKSWSPEEGAVVWATYVAISQNCPPGVNKNLDVLAEYARRGLNFQDFRPNGKYGTAVVAKLQNTESWLQGMGLGPACKGMREYLAAYWPEAL